MRKKVLFIGWPVGVLCAFVASYGIENQQHWWSYALTAFILPAGAWFLFGTIITFVVITELIFDAAKKPSKDAGEQ